MTGCRRVMNIYIYTYIFQFVSFVCGFYGFFLLACHKFENSSRYESIHSGIGCRRKFSKQFSRTTLSPDAWLRGISFYQLPKIHVYASREIILTRYFFFETTSSFFSRDTVKRNRIIWFANNCHLSRQRRRKGREGNN